jgi:cytochrome c biogenesis protein CcmG, thiol:disulfide interchange protein DsbE
MRRLLAPVPIAVICAIVALVALLAYGLSESEPDRDVDRDVASGVRNPAPPLELPRLSGLGAETLEDYKGKVVVLNFWASWCEPCRKESPLLQRWHRRMERRQGTVLGVDVQDVTGDARDFIAKYKLTYPMLRDGEGLTRESFAIIGFPETFVLDRRGRIAAVRRGPVDERFMRERVLPLLQERA